MANVDLTLVSRNNIPRRTVVQVATITVGDRGDGSAPVSADVNQLFTIPAGAYVLRTWLIPITGFNEGTSATISLGDDGSTTRFHSAVDIKTVTANVPVVGTVKYRYATSNTVDAIITYGGGTAAATGEIQIGIEYVAPASSERYG